MKNRKYDTGYHFLLFDSDTLNTLALVKSALFEYDKDS